MDGWMGKILRVDLTQSKIAVEDLDAGLARKIHRRPRACLENAL